MKIDEAGLAVGVLGGATRRSNLRLISSLARSLCLLAALPAVPAPALAQPACAPGGFENDGFVTVQGDRLMLGGQPFRVRGANFTGGRGTPVFPLVELTHPDGTVHLEEVRPYSQWTDTYDSARTYAELALLKNSLGINAVRLITPRPRYTTPPYDPEPVPWFQPSGSINPIWLARLQDTLCSCRRLGIKAQVALLWNIENEGRELANLPYPPEFMGFLDAYLASVVPVLAGDPAVLSWEISNEVLPWSEAPTHAHLHAVQLIRHLIQEVRSHDSSHLVTSGEVAVPSTHESHWRYPTPELYRFDLDGTGELTGLVDYVDYISPHFYSFGVKPWTGGTGGTYDYGPMRPVIEGIKKRTNKPVTMGEMNREMTWEHQFPEDDDPIRATFFAMAREGVHNACRNDPTCPAGAHPGASGFLAWEPEPILDLRRGSYVREWHCETQPPPEPKGCDWGKWPFIRFLNPPRGVHYNDIWELLYYPDDNPATLLEPLAPGRIFRKALHAPADFSADGTSDIAVYQPSTGQWLVSGKGSAALGAPGDIPVGVDWNGDGRAEPAVFRPVSQNPSQTAAEWWLPGVENDLPILFGRNGDVPVPGDYDGDGDAEIAVFRPHADSDPNVAAWLVRLPPGSVLNHGVATDIPVPADYDGDGDVDIAVFRPSSATWWVLGGPSESVPYGAPGDIPVPGDYDADGDDDMAVFRPSTGQWLVRGIAGSGAVIVPPLPGDVPAPADYDGDSKIDFAVFRSSTGQWFLEGGATVTFGGLGDIPVVRRPQY